MPFEHSTFGWFAHSLCMGVCGRPTAIFYSALLYYSHNIAFRTHKKKQKRQLGKITALPREVFQFGCSSTVVKGSRALIPLKLSDYYFHENIEAEINKHEIQMLKPQ
jgi:hypothetical protein